MGETEKGLKIVKAVVADCELIHSMARCVFPATYREILTPEQIDYMMDWMYAPENIRKQMDEGHIYQIAYLEGRPVGYVSVRPDGTDCFHLEKIYVLPECQKAKCGVSLFRAAIDYVRSVHPAPFVLELNVNRYNPALGFYRRMGMRIDREGDFDIGNGFYMNDYIMRLDVNS